MLYKFFNKKGNITVVLIGLISVMILMTIALSKRMTGHTQLLTLGDYTQISRYFLESYISQIMQQVREQVNDPQSALNEEICKGIDGAGTEKDLKPFFKYKSSSELEFIQNQAYGSNNKITNTGYEIFLTDKTKPIDYPKGVEPPADKDGEEKKGYIEVTCYCEFNKRKYNLKVQYPFSVVYRMTPIIKDFMLYVDRMNCEQNFGSSSNFDKLNLVKIKDNEYAPSGEQDFRNYNSSNADVSQMVLMQPLDVNEKYFNTDVSGKVYLGAPFQGSFGSSDVYDQPVYLNLTGGDVDKNISETFLISARDIGVATDSVLEPRTFLPIPPGDKYLMLNCWPVPLENYANANMSVMGFCDQAKEVLSDAGTWRLKDFLIPPDNNVEHLKRIEVGVNKLEDSLQYATSLKLFGINVYNQNTGSMLVPREIYGNVFARFIVLTFWWPNGCAGLPLYYDLNRKIDEIPEQILTYDPITGDPITRKFEPKTDEELYSKDVDYKFFMSKIVSGEAWENYKDKDWASNFFMPMNMKLDVQTLSESNHELFNESNFKPKDGFEIDGVQMRFNKFGEEWFGVSPEGTDKENLSPIEKRIGRAFKNGEEFLDAVGYPEKFLVNGVVYVGGGKEGEDKGLTLDKDLILDDKNCSGGIILVDGPINIRNIYRGDSKLKANNFKLEDNSAGDMYKKWNKESPSDAEKIYAIPPDKIITFVSLKGDPITINGNIVLGVQLVNFGDPNSQPSNFSNLKEEIQWSDEVTDGIIFYGSIACNRLNLIDKIQKFGKIRKANKFDNILQAPFFLYPPVMATSTPPLAVQIMDDMRSYQLTSGVAPE